MNIFKKLLALSIFAGSSEASTLIKNIKAVRSINLEESGSNLVTFGNDVVFENPAKEPFYYYTVAKDFEWSFLALQVLT